MGVYMTDAQRRDKNSRDHHERQARFVRTAVEQEKAKHAAEVAALRAKIASLQAQLKRHRNEAPTAPDPRPRAKKSKVESGQQTTLDTALPLHAARARELETASAVDGAAAETTEGSVMPAGRGSNAAAGVPMDVRAPAAATDRVHAPGGRVPVPAPLRRSDRVRRKQKQVRKKRRKEMVAQARAAAEEREAAKAMGIKFAWKGVGVQARGKDIDDNVSTYYRAFTRTELLDGNEEVFKVGDTVQVYGSEQCADDIKLGDLQDMYEDRFGTMWVRLNWYTQTEIPPSVYARAHEVSLSNHVDDVEVSRIRAKLEEWG